MIRASALAACVLGAALCASRLDAARSASGLSLPAEDEPLRFGEASLALLGGFRGLYVDYLWYRAEGRFLETDPPLYDLPLLYDLIGRLQPRYTDMWWYTATRLSFDAPNHVRDPSPETDWVWIRRGIGHLRKGVRLNARHPERAKLLFHLAEIYHRRCTVGDHLPMGDYDRARRHCQRRLREDLGEDAYEEIVSLIHEMREDPETLPAWMDKAAHARTQAAIHALSDDEEDRNLALAEEEWAWIIHSREEAHPRNRWLRENAEFYRGKIPHLRRNFIDRLAAQRRAIGLERAGMPEAGGAWRGILREALFTQSRPDPIAQKHLRRLGLLAAAYEAVAAEIEAMLPGVPPARREDLAGLKDALRKAAVLERARRGGDA